MKIIKKTVATASIVLTVYVSGTAVLSSAVILGMTAGLTVLSVTIADAIPVRFAGSRGVSGPGLRSGR